MVDFDEKPKDEMEQRLSLGLRSRPAPEGFADRVVARVRDLQPPIIPPATHRWPGGHGLLRWTIAAILLLTTGLGGFWAHERQRRIEGERARQQVLLALRITSVTIRAVRDQVNRDNHN